MTLPRIAVITPLFNEEGGFAAYVAAIESVLLSRKDADYNIMLIDDGSRDRTWELILAQCRRSPRFRALRLSRNFGEHAAITAGLDLCDADAVVVLAADLQDPPETVVEFVDAWRRGAQVVWGHRKTRVDARGRVWASRLFLALFRRFAAQPDSKVTTGGFLLIDRRVVESLRQLREHSRLIFGLVAWSGFQQDIVYYDRQPRKAGKSGWSYGRMLAAMYDALVGFSSIVPRIVTFLGIVFSAIGVLSAIYFFINAIVGHPTVQGWAGLMVALSLFFGITFFILGMICEYLLRIYREASRRPIYFIAADTAEENDRVRLFRLQAEDSLCQSPTT